MALPMSRPSSRAVTATSCRESSRRSSSWPGSSTISTTCESLTSVPSGVRSGSSRRRGQPVDARRIGLDPDGDDPVAFEDGRSRLAQHRRVGGRGDVARRQAEPLGVGKPQAEADRRPRVNQPVEHVHDARDLLDRFRDLGRLLLEPALIGRKQFHFDRLGGPHQVADQVAQDAGEFPGQARQLGVEAPPQFRDDVRGFPAAVCFSA